MNNIYPCLLAVMFTFLQIKIGIAQGYIPVTSQIRTPHGNVPYTYHVPSGMNYYYGRGSISVKYEFNVVRKNGEQKIIKSKINLQDSVHSLTYKENGEKKKLLPTETREIYRFTQSGRK